MKSVLMISVILAGVFVVALGCGTTGPALAQTAPDYVALDAIGVVEFFDTIPGDRAFSLVEVTAGPDDILVSFWSPTNVKMKPTYGYAAADTVIPIVAGKTMAFYFQMHPKPSHAYVTGGTATFKAE